MFGQHRPRKAGFGPAFGPAFGPVLIPAFISAFIGLMGLTAGCSSASSGTTVDVTNTDTSCSLSTQQVPAGTVTWQVTNNGSLVTEVYVYAAGDSIVAEKEDITPGSSVSFDAKVSAGSYEVACKPGQTGDGIRTTLTVQ